MVSCCSHQQWEPATILINGQVAATGNVSVDYAGTSSGVRIGGDFCCYGNNFPKIDDVRIWSIQRSANDIKAGCSPC
jgi:hypothetical protein